MKRLRIPALAVNLAMSAIVFITWGRISLLPIRHGRIRLSIQGLRGLRLYTILSNLLMGVAALVYCICLVLLLAGVIKKIPYAVRLLKYSATVSVLLTFLTVLLFLGPTFGYKGMFDGSNLWFHLLISLAAAASFWLLEKDGPLPFKASFFAVIPTFIYAVYYLINVLSYGIKPGDFSHDWYGFAQKGLGLALVAFVVMLLAAWVIALVTRLPKR